MAAPTTAKVSLKLLIDTKCNKVLFAEASKEFVDFLCSLLSLPMAAVIRMVSKQGMVGSLGDLYESIENLSESYLEISDAKDSLLKPQVYAPGAALPLLLPKIQTSKSTCFYGCGSVSVSSGSSTFSSGCGSVSASSGSSTFSSGFGSVSASSGSSTFSYPSSCFGSSTFSSGFGSVSASSGSSTFSYPSSCFGSSTFSYPSSCSSHVTNDPTAICPQTGSRINRPLTFVDPPNKKTCALEGGYVKGGVAKYMIMDNLEVRPMSTISGITIMLNQFNVKDLGVLEEKVVDVGMDQGVKLLKLSLQSKTILTEVFLGKKPSS